MPVYVPDIWPLVMRLLEALDAGRTMSFEQLRRRVSNGDLENLFAESGNHPILFPDWLDLTAKVEERLTTNKNDEAETYYVSQNGYCLLIAVLLEIERMFADGPRRP